MPGGPRPGACEPGGRFDPAGFAALKPVLTGGFPCWERKERPSPSGTRKKIMRVQGPTSAAPREVRRKPAPEASGFRVDAGGGEAPRAEGVSAAQPLTNLDTLVVLQEAPNDQGAKKRALKRASDMLDQLEAIRLDLLDGGVPAPRLEALVRLVRLQRDQVNDPRLAHVLDEIELRARVELAKLGQSC